MEVRGNTILITGGSSGIGLALAIRYQALGNKVIIAARDIDKLREVLKSFPGMEAFQCDLTRQTDIDALVVFIEQNHQDLNVLVNNAGIQYNYDFLGEQNLVNKIEYEVGANFTSVIKLCGLLLPTLMKNKHPAIVNLSSGLALSPKRSAPVYCATKAAIHNFTVALRYQLNSTGVKVFEVLPSLIDTPMTEGRGANKISADQLVTEFMKNFKKDNYEIYIGKTKLLKLIVRLWPSLAGRIMKGG